MLQIIGQFLAVFVILWLCHAILNPRCTGCFVCDQWSVFRTKHHRRIVRESGQPSGPKPLYNGSSKRDDGRMYL